MRKVWPRPKFEKISEIWSTHVNKNGYDLNVHAFPIFSVRSNICSSLMDNWCIVFVGKTSLTGSKTLSIFYLSPF